MVNNRYILASGGCTTVIGCKATDVVYSPLPLYHSVAGMIALAGTMRYGLSMVMREKFSARNYWADCVRYRVTVSVMSINIPSFVQDLTEKNVRFFFFHLGCSIHWANLSVPVKY